MVLRGLGAPGPKLEKRVENGSFFMQVARHLRDHFRQCGRKRGHQKMSVFWDPLLSAENRPQAPQKVHSGASGSQQAPNMDPKSDTFGCLWKVDFCCYL